MEKPHKYGPVNPSRNHALTIYNTHCIVDSLVISPGPFLKEGPPRPGLKPVPAIDCSESGRVGGYWPGTEE